MTSFSRRITQVAMIIIYPVDNSVKETAGDCVSYQIKITRMKRILFAICKTHAARIYWMWRTRELDDEDEILLI